MLPAYDVPHNPSFSLRWVPYPQQRSLNGYSLMQTLSLKSQDRYGLVDERGCGRGPNSTCVGYKGKLWELDDGVLMHCMSSSSGGRYA
jgi:hypothetical protein